MLGVTATSGNLVEPPGDLESEDEAASGAEQPSEPWESEAESAAEDPPEHPPAQEPSDAEPERAAEDPLDQPPAREELSDAARKEAQIFQMIISLRDNWLHRGEALQDLDIQTYAELIERVEKPVAGSRLRHNVLQQHFFAFDEHYKMSAGYIQLLRSGRDYPPNNNNNPTTKPTQHNNRNPTTSNYSSLFTKPMKPRKTAV